MPTCRQCSADVPIGSRFCGTCGCEVDSSATPVTRTVPAQATRSSSIDQGRFTAGTLLDGRYRIIGLLGRGGMGEVYRAEDLKLGQPVALKFLPLDKEQDGSRLARLLNEVRLARQVSHPNVCRVYDVGEMDGSHFMAMEYVDGEDLASLLRRIGRLPQEKAIEIARQICAGLAAAHGQGILHRDLKPANIMIDGRGRVKLADFGLAELGLDLTGMEARAGTPAYMSPEQMNGREVTVRSDVYALGLVLFEIFTGEAVFGGKSLEDIAKLHERPTPTQPSTLVNELDDTVERVIMRCLETDPAARPASALAVAAALPGGDPLAAALAAGETPSPEMVAQAGPESGLKPRVAWALLLGFLVLLGTSVAGHQRYTLIGRAIPALSAGVLEAKAKEVLATLGYGDPPRDSHIDFEYNRDFVRHLRTLPSVTERVQMLDRPQPAALQFAYRQSPDWIVYRNAGSIGEWVNRTGLAVPGDVRIRLDATGRLVQFDTTLPDSVGPIAVAVEPDWNLLLSAAGFDPSALTESAPEWLPPTGFDNRRAWTGTYPDAPEIPVRLEAAALAGRPVYFRIIEPWTQPRVESPLSTMRPGGLEGLVGILFTVLWVSSLTVIGILALRNLQKGRGDRRTAVRFAFALAAVRMAWFLFGNHYPNTAEVDTLIGNMAWTMWRFGFAYAFYVALEPYVRKLWPHMLTSWVRLFDNRFRDPLVGRDVLVGLTLGALTGALRWGTLLTFEKLGLPHDDLGMGDFSLESLLGIRGALLGFFGVVTNVAFGIFMMVTITFLMRLAVRGDRLTLIPMILVTSLFNLGNHPVALVSGVIVSLILWITLFRFGLLTFVTFFIAQDLLGQTPLTLDLGAWWAAPTWLALGALLMLAVWNFRVSLAGQAAFTDKVLGD